MLRQNILYLRHEARIINTAAIKRNGKWSLTTVHDLLCQGFLRNPLQPSRDMESGPENNDTANFTLRWDSPSHCSLPFLKAHTKISTEKGSAKEARSILDKCGTDVVEDVKQFDDYSEFISEWKSYYDPNIPQYTSKEVEEIRLLTYDSYGTPWERGICSHDARILLTSIDSFDIPLGDSTDNISWTMTLRGYRVHVCQLLCWVEMITTLSLSSEKRFCTKEIREVLDNGTNLKSRAKLLAIGSATVISFFKKGPLTTELVHALEREGIHIDVNTDDNVEGKSGISPFMKILLSARSKKSKENAIEKQGIYGTADENAISRLFLDRIVVARKTNSHCLEAAVITDFHNSSWTGVELSNGNRDQSFKLTLAQRDVMKLLRGRADRDGHNTSYAARSLERIQVDGDYAKGPIPVLKKYAAWAYTATVLVVSVLSVVLNWKSADSTWERIFGGVEFLTFALVGVFGIVKLSGED